MGSAKVVPWVGAPTKALGVNSPVLGSTKKSSGPKRRSLLCSCKTSFKLCFTNWYKFFFFII